MSLNIKIELTIDTVLAIQNAARLGSNGNAVQTARDHTAQAVVDAVEKLPYKITPSASGRQIAATTPVPNTKRSPSSASPSPPPTKAMKNDPGSVHFFVRDLCGKDFTIYLPLSSTIEDVKNEIEEQDGVPPDTQRLIFAGRQLQDGRTLESYNVTEASILYVFLRLKGS